MANARDASSAEGRLARLLTTDFCPWANRFVYWLKEPIGWFVLAATISVAIGCYISPVGWTLSASLGAIIAVGMIWPWLAVRAVRCRLEPEAEAVHEDQACRMRLSIENRLPLPLWGLSVEGYLDTVTTEQVPTVALSCVAPLCVNEYAISVKPSLRGHYPQQTPQATCSFPFGIWTARRPLTDRSSLTVWPKVYGIDGRCPLVGRRFAVVGEGDRGGGHGDFIGVRHFRQGDSARHVNWVASARSDTLMVTERGGPQCVSIDVVVDPRAQGTRAQLADRIRIASSLLMHLHEQQIPVGVQIGKRFFRPAAGRRGQLQILNALADVPLDGSDDVLPAAKFSRQTTLEISEAANGEALVRVLDPSGGLRLGRKTAVVAVGCGPEIGSRLRAFWTELQRGEVADEALAS